MVFSFFKKGKLQIISPVTGNIIPLEEVPDPVFSQKMMGEGIAVIPTAGDIYAPVNGTIILTAATKHAVGIRAEDGTEILIHIGLETVALNGKGFKLAVQEGEKIAVGQLLIEVDWEYIEANAKSKITPIVITNSQELRKKFTLTEEENAVQGETVIISCT